MKYVPIVLLIFLPIFFLSCAPQQKMTNYLQDVTDTTIKAEVQFPELKIQKNDILSIRVYSASTKPEISDALYNLPSAREMGISSTEGSAGFLVDVNGNIEYPRIGHLHVE